MANIPVFLASDNNYAPFVASTIASMCDNTKSFIDFYILDAGITVENQEKIANLKDKFNNFAIEFIKIDVENEFKDFFTSGHISLAAYNRFLIPILKPELKKAIYTDIDIIVKGDIAELYNEDLKGYRLAAAWEEFFEHNMNIERKKRLGLSDTHNYFNSGILIIDCEKWRENNITEKLLEIAVRKHDILNGHDQDVLNIYFEDSYLSLAPKYCYLTEYYKFGTSPDDMVIRHYSRIKPWFISPEIEDVCHTDHNLFWRYAKMTDLYENALSRVKIDNKAEIVRKYRVFDLIYDRHKAK